MQDKLGSVGEDHWIETSSGRRAFKVDGKALRVRDTFTIKITEGQVVAQMQERVARVRDTMKIDCPGRPSAAIKKAVISPLRDRFVLEADDVMSGRSPSRAISSTTSTPSSGGWL